jgi:hypothetical protein
MPDSQIKIFFSYSCEDSELRSKLEQHLGPLKRQQKILSWHDQEIIPGADRSREIISQLNSADIILLLISSDFVDSDFCYCIELECARKRHDAGEARIIPVFLRPVDLQALENTPFKDLQGLPSCSRPVTTWSNADEAFSSIAKGIRLVVNELQKQKECAGDSQAMSIKQLHGGINLSEDRIKLRRELRSAPENATSILKIFQDSIFEITIKVKNYLSADRVTVFFLNICDQELWSLIAESKDQNSLEITVPIGKGFAGKAAKTKKPINIGFDLYEHPESQETRDQDKKNNYRTYTLLSVPILNEGKEVIAVIQFLNKLKITNSKKKSQ